MIDAGSWIAGPVAATILADFGADVIKVESPLGDGYRRYYQSAAAAKSDVNYAWIADNRNKRGIVLDLRTEPGRDVLLRLVARCDVYITNQPFATRRSLRLNYEDLAPHNPRMIFASLTSFGETGPDRELEAFDAVAWWSRSGMMDSMHVPGAEPAWSNPGMGDHPAGVALYASIVTALLRRERTGKGGLVHTSLLANGAWSNTVHVQAGLVGADFGRAYDPPPGAIRELYETADGRLLQIYMLRTQESIDRLLLALGREDLIADPRFADAPARAAHQVELTAELRATVRTWESEALVAALRAEGLAVGLVARPWDVGTDAQVVANGIVLPPADPAVPAPAVVTHPVGVEGLPVAGIRPAPGFGEHTDEILAELGFDAAAIGALRASGAVL